MNRRVSVVLYVNHRSDRFALRPKNDTECVGGAAAVISISAMCGLNELLEALGMDMEFLEVIQFAACDKVDFEIKIKK